MGLAIRFMDGGEAFRAMKLTKPMFDEGLVVHRQKAHLHPGVAKYYEMLRNEYDQHPEHFHPVK